MKRHFPLLAATVATLFSVGGSLFAQDASKVEPFETPVVSKDADFAERQLAFALNTFRRAVETESANANTLVAPFGAYRVLGALSLGSAGQTKTEIDAALFRSDSDDADWKKAVADANAALTEAPETTLVGGLWTAPGFKLKKEFAADLKKFSGQKAESLDFAQESALKEVNAWFSENTNGRIPSLLDSLAPETRLLLADATTFDGRWKHAFDPKETRNRAFDAIDGEEVDFPSMSKTAKFAYYDADDFQYLEAPYDGDRFSLVVVLPNDYASYAKVERELTPAKLLECRAEAKEALVVFRFPKFTVRRSVDLASTLQKIGVVSAFALDADLTPIAGDANLRLDQAKQGAFLAVDETGTVAAAATAASAAPKAVPDANFYADRPFFYMIRHNDSGAVLFAGRFVSPQQAEATETAEIAEEETDEPEVAEEIADEETDEPEVAEEVAEEETDEPEVAEEVADEETDEPEVAEEVADEPSSDAKTKPAPPKATPASGSLR